MSPQKGEWMQMAVRVKADIPVAYFITGSICNIASLVGEYKTLSRFLFIKENEQTRQMIKEALVFLVDDYKKIREKYIDKNGVELMQPYDSMLNETLQEGGLEELFVG